MSVSFKVKIIITWSVTRNDVKFIEEYGDVHDQASNANGLAREMIGLSCNHSFFFFFRWIQPWFLRYAQEGASYYRWNRWSRYDISSRLFRSNHLVWQGWRRSSLIVIIVVINIQVINDIILLRKKTVVQHHIELNKWLYFFLQKSWTFLLLFL